MSWDFFLYPLIHDIPFVFRWRRTWTWIVLSLWLIWWYVLFWKERNRSTTDSNIVRVEPKEMQERTQSLRSTIDTQNTRARYIEYQLLLRDVIWLKQWIDIKSSTLEDCKEGITWSDSQMIIDLLERTYYFPYNLESSNSWEMISYCDQLLLLLSADE